MTERNVLRNPAASLLRSHSPSPPSPPAPLGSGDAGLLPTTPSTSPAGAASNSQRSRSLRKPSPRLLERMKWLDTHKSRVVSSPALTQDKIGRIPESQLRELESLHRDDSIRVERRGQAWSGLPPHLDLDLPEPLHQGILAAELGDVGSDHSSIISIGEKIMASDTDDSEPGLDTQKYRMPESEKTPLASAPARPLACEASTNGGSQSPVSRQDTPSPNTTGNYRHDTDRQSADEPSDFENYISNFTHSRAPSIYTLSRASFSSQLGQLTSIQLPSAASLSSSISSIPRSTVAAKALDDAAQQIRRWIQKASEVLNGLNAEDDVDWAAAGGREGLDDVDQAINRFEKLINVYVVAIEELEQRPDIAELPAAQLQSVVTRMEDIMGEWKKIKDSLRGVKEQVEVAMEWEELWNTVLGEIGLEVEALGRLVFEMEERRHRSVMSETDQHPGLDIGELETIVEETPSRTQIAPGGQRLSLPGVASSPTSPAPAPVPPLAKEDSNLLALFARMQPLRASLDFLPIRLSGFQGRAEVIFPTACQDLSKRRDVLEEKWKKLEADAESLRRELSEDQWVMIFRNAGRQAQKMCESVERSYNKLKEALDTGAHHSNLPSTAKKIESYEAKKMHYGSAIGRVIAIIDRGVRDRLTVNGEILRLQSEIKRRWSHLQGSMRELDLRVGEVTVTTTSQQLRDSISTILSTEHSTSSSMIETPGSSPASSVIMMSRKNSEHEPSTPNANGKRQSSLTRRTSRSGDLSKRHSSLPLRFGSNSTVPRSSSLGTPPNGNIASPSRFSGGSATPTSFRPSPTQPTSNKPRWNGSTNMRDTVVGHNFKPLSSTTPSPYKRPSSTVPPRPGSRTSSIPLPSPLSKGTSSYSRDESSALTSPPPRHVSAPLSTTSKRQSMLVTPSKSHFPSTTLPARPASSLQRPSSRLSRPSAPALRTPSATQPANNVPSTPPTPSHLSTPATAAATRPRRSSSTSANGTATAAAVAALAAAAAAADNSSPISQHYPTTPATLTTGSRVAPLRSASAMASSRSGSAMGGSRRISMLPQPQLSPQSHSGLLSRTRPASGMVDLGRLEERPRWR
ncbi:MAG: hypothetical protein M1822_005472 [Bathelium mastoideum]|nr:MAG: hypothetical protein M1822_005472 [Bathelium mastoideum]